MPISEAARNDLYTGLTEVLGPNRAETLMSVIRLHDLDEVATKGDLALLKTEFQSLRDTVENLDVRFQKVEQKLDHLIFVLIAGLFAVIATLIGVGVLS